MFPSSFDTDVWIDAFYDPKVYWLFETSEEQSISIPEMSRSHHLVCVVLNNSTFEWVDCDLALHHYVCEKPWNGGMLSTICNRYISDNFTIIKISQKTFDSDLL